MPVHVSAHAYVRLRPESLRGPDLIRHHGLVHHVRAQCPHDHARTPRPHVHLYFIADLEPVFGMYVQVRVRTYVRDCVCAHMGAFTCVGKCVRMCVCVCLCMRVRNLRPDTSALVALMRRESSR